MTELIEVHAEPVGPGVWFAGPERRVAWSPVGWLSSALSYAVAHDVAAHPWDGWPSPKDELREVRPPARIAPKARPRKSTRGRKHV